MIYLNKDFTYMFKLNNRKAIVSNRFTGNYVHIPIECYEALVYGSEKRIALDKLVKAFEDKEDQKYYLRLLEILKDLGVISPQNDNQLKLSCIGKIDISLTNRCNLHCGYCCTESENSKKFKEMNFEEVKNMIDIVLKNLNPRTINLSGGEIFVRNDIYQIISYIRSKFDGCLIISTNGILIKEEKIDFLVNNIDAINISLDGYNEETVSKERGRGTFAKVVHLISKLKNKGFDKITLSLVVSKQTEEYIEKFKQLSNELGVESLTRGFVAIGRGKNNYAYVEDKKDSQFFATIKDNHKTGFENTMVCSAGIKSIFINYDGNVFMCANLQEDKFKICEISEIDELFLEKVSSNKFKAYETLEKIKTKSFDYCDGCEYKLFCCKCPASMIYIYDNEELLKYNCKKFKQELCIH
ncbi:subtilosin maturase AlbA [Paraclostridium bifermentans]|uniref:radical SAM protein n=1 Tax=Paraclostridium bifermentans TaxID=1490 RepID=UPI003C61479E